MCLSVCIENHNHYEITSHGVAQSKFEPTHPDMGAVPSRITGKSRGQIVFVSPMIPVQHVLPEFEGGFQGGKTSQGWDNYILAALNA